MRIVALGDVVSPAGSRARSDTSHPVYSVTKHDGFVPSLEYFKKQVFSRDVAGYKRVDVGDFAYATIHLDEGSIGIAPERALISPMYTVFRPDHSRVDPGYLIRYLKSPHALNRYKQLGRGAVHRRKAISLSALGELIIPLPPLPEQRRIAAILDAADAIRTKRRQALIHLDTLAQSVFHAMFGTTQGGGNTVRFGEIARLTAGRNLVADDPDSDSEFRVLKISAVTSGTYRATESKPLPLGYVPPENHLVHAGDLLMSRANTAELVGAVSYVDETPANIALPDKVWRFEWNDPESNPRFYRVLLQSSEVRHKISRLASGTGGSMKNISKAKLETLELPAIAVAEQRRFATRVERINAHRTTLQRALAADDALFASLQSRAFKGEL